MTWPQILFWFALVANLLCIGVNVWMMRQLRHSRRLVDENLKRSIELDAELTALLQ